MALKTLILKGKLDRARAEFEKLCSKDAEFSTREAELETAIGEITNETPEADRIEIENQVNAFQEEKTAHDDNKSNLEREISDLEKEIKEEEERSKNAGKPRAARDDEGRKETMNTRTKFFGMNAQERDAFFAREDVSDFLARAKELAAQKRTASGAELLIPTVMLDLVKENIAKYSKLIGHIRTKPVAGKARQIIMGAVPEGIWTEMCANLNELELDFADVEVDGYKVGGFFAISNATLEDADINLASELISALGQAIGLALDKAIVYGTGTKMPLGIVTRLTQTAEPDNYTSSRPWVNLSATNVLSVSGKTDTALFKEIITASGAAKGDYSAKNMIWIMNKATHTKLVANSLSINSAGAIVSGINNQMPGIGGEIIELNFIPNDVMIGGYGDLYLLVERAGTAIAQSEHARFTEDQTVIRGIARYDGCPVIPEGFVAIGIGGSKPTANAVTFTADKANTAEASEE